MSDELEAIRKVLFPPDSKRLHQAFQVVVIEVNETNFTCTVRKNDLVNYYEVRLRAIIDEKLTGFAFIPKIGSKVQVGRIANSNELFITKFSEIDKIIYTAGEDKKISFSLDLEKAEFKIGDKISTIINETSIKLTNDQSTFEMTGDKITFNEGKLGLIKIDALTNKLNDLVDAFNNHTHEGVIVSVTGQATGYEGSSDTPKNKADKFNMNSYENTRVMQ